MLLPHVVLHKPVAVMIHGAGGGGWEYKFWKPAFEKAGYRVVAKDLLPAKGGLEKTTFDEYVRQIVKASGPHPDVLVGASMGGVLVLKAAEILKPKAIILACSAAPMLPGLTVHAKAPYPPLVKWKNGPYSDTVASMPDSDEATRRYAWPRWRDESGLVLNAIAKGVKVAQPRCPVLSLIPEADDTVPPARQQALADWCRADAFRFRGMSHVGVLLSRRGGQVAKLAISWLRGLS